MIEFTGHHNQHRISKLYSHCVFDLYWFFLSLALSPLSALLSSYFETHHFTPSFLIRELTNSIAVFNETSQELVAPFLLFLLRIIAVFFSISIFNSSQFQQCEKKSKILISCSSYTSNYLIEMVLALTPSVQQQQQQRIEHKNQTDEQMNWLA